MPSTSRGRRGVAGTYFATSMTLGMRTYLTILPVALAAAAFAVPGAPASVVLAWLGAGVIAEVAVAACFAAGWWASQRVTHPRVAVVIVVLGAYAIRGVVLVVVTSSLDVPDTTSPTLRILASMINMSLWTFLVGAAWQARAQYHRELREAGDRLARAREGLLQDEAMSAPLADEIRSVQSGLTSLLQRYESSDIDAWAAELQHAIDDDLRPLSHRLAAAGRRPMSRSGRLRQILWRAGRQRVLLTPILVILVAITTTNAMLRYPLDEAVLVLTVYVPLLLAAAGLIIAARRSPLPDSAVNLLTIVAVAAVVPLAMAGIVENLLPRQADPLGPTAVMLASVTVIVVVALVQAASAVARLDLEQINEQIDALDLAIEERWHATRSASSDAADHLHNVVQSRLTAVRLEASAAAASLDPGLLADAQRLVAEDVLAPRGGTDPLEELRQAALSWSGVISIALELDSELSGHDPGLTRLTSFAQEAIANAVRHGDATRVEIFLRRDGDDLICSVRDNGTWSTPSGPGIGLASSQDLTLDVNSDAYGTTVTAATRRR